MAAAFHYPNEPGVSGGPTISYIPEIDPVIDGSANPDRSGLNYHRTADGELQGNAQHAIRWTARRRFKVVSEAKRIERDAFFAATRGLRVRYIDETLDDYKTVKMIGESIEGRWTPTEGDWWERTEELEETTDMADIDDLGNFRLGTGTFTDTEMQKKIFFDGGAFTDAAYRVHSCVAFISSTGEKIDANPVLPLEDDGITVRITAPPGMAGSGATVRVDVSAVRP